MMRADLEALGRRAVACAGWRWMEGMLAVPAPGSEYEGWCRILRASEDGVSSWTDEDGHILDSEEDGDFATFADLIPWLGEPATLGCLLALVREKWAIPTLAPVCKEGVWMFWAGGLPDALYQLRATTEVELLVAALEVQNG